VDVGPHTDVVWADLNKILNDQQDQLSQLRRWASRRLSSEQDVSVVRLERDLLQELAMLFDLSEADLVDSLRTFTPDTVPRI
jgi:hypothetical protein